MPRRARLAAALLLAFALGVVGIGALGPLGTGAARAAAPLDASESPPPRPRLHRCDLGMPRPFRCGHIMVPLDRAEPAWGQTKVAFAIRRRRDLRRPSLGTIFAMDGGPGYASTAKPYASSLIAALGPVLRRRDLVLYDMRGTGLSDVVDCEALQGGLIQESIAISQCANQLGPRRVGAYTSGEAAEDMDQLRRALDLGRIFFYGDSFGTFFGQAFAVRHPDALRGLILDSACPGDDPYYRTLLPAGLNGLRIACRDAPTCSGDPVARLTRVVDVFHRERRSTESLIAFLLEAGTLAPRSYLSLDQGDRRFLAGEPRRLDRLLAPEPAGEKLSEYSSGLAIAVECNDYKTLWDPDEGLRTRVAELSAATGAIRPGFFAPFGNAEYLLSSAARLTPCLYWPAPPRGPTEPAIPSDWRSPSSFPTLITSGQVDDVTSVREAHEVRARFPRSRLYVVPDRGHVSSLYFPFRSPEVGVIRRFITSH